MLDGSSLAKQAGVPDCNTDHMFHVSRENGAVYFRKHALKGRSAPHFFGTYSAPWFLEQVCELPQLRIEDLKRPYEPVYSRCLMVKLGWVAFKVVAAEAARSSY